MVYAENEGEVFLGRSVTKTTNMSEETMQKVDAEVRRIIDEQYALARRLIEEHSDKMHAMAKACWSGKPSTPTSSTTSWPGTRAAASGGATVKPDADGLTGPTVRTPLARIEPVIRGALTLGVPVSVDTFKPEVMQRVLDWGVDIINDVRALQEAGSALVVARHGSCGVCLMHMHRDPQSMQLAPMEGDAVPVVRAFLAQAAARLQVLGVEHTRIVLDPGIGFGKTVAQNCALLARQRALADLGFPLLVGWSRKSTLGAITAVDGVATPPAERLLPSVAAALLAVERGAAVVRVHDVRETVQALRVWQACSGHPT
jgi:dihydropteroate synthase